SGWHRAVISATQARTCSLGKDASAAAPAFASDGDTAILPINPRELRRVSNAWSTTRSPAPDSIICEVTLPDHANVDGMTGLTLDIAKCCGHGEYSSGHERCEQPGALGLNPGEPDAQRKPDESTAVGHQIVPERASGYDGQQRAGQQDCCDRAIGCHGRQRDG